MNTSALVTRHPAPGGFTLLELLVVIAVLAVLASLLLPATNRGLMQARRAQCLGNLRQWGLALQMYEDDNEDLIPRRGQGVRPLTTLDRPEDWFNALPPLMSLPTLNSFVAQGMTNSFRAATLFACPEAQPAPQRHPLSYAMNLYLSPWNRTEPHGLYDIESPSCTVFLADGGVGYSSALPAAAEYSPQPRHGGTASLLFLDGHAESYAGPSIGCNTGLVTRADVVWIFDTNAAAFAPGK